MAKEAPLKEAPLKIIDAVNAAKAEDLAEIDQRIADGERELDGLKALRKVLDIRLNGKTPKAARGTKAKAGSNGVQPSVPAGRGDAIRLGHLRTRIGKHLVHAGRSRVATVASDLGASAAEIEAALADSVLFVVSDGFVSLTSEGKVRFG